MTLKSGVALRAVASTDLQFRPGSYFWPLAEVPSRPAAPIANGHLSPRLMLAAELVRCVHLILAEGRRYSPAAPACCRQKWRSRSSASRVIPMTPRKTRDCARGRHSSVGTIGL